MAGFMPFFVISSVEQFQDFHWYNEWVIDEQGDVSRFKIFASRGIFALIVIACTFISDDIIEILRFAGSVTMPILGFILPIFMKYWRGCSRGEEFGWAMGIHDLW
jgi:hypothetical protein